MFFVVVFSLSSSFQLFSSPAHFFPIVSRRRRPHHDQHDKKSNIRTMLSIAAPASAVVPCRAVAAPITEGVHTTIGKGFSGSLSSNSLSRNGAPGNGARHVMSYSPVASFCSGISGFSAPKYCGLPHRHSSLS